MTDHQEVMERKLSDGFGGEKSARWGVIATAQRFNVAAIENERREDFLGDSKKFAVISRRKKVPLAKARGTPFNQQPEDFLRGR